jgi:type I restriction enzyme S subunit
VSFNNPLYVSQKDATKYRLRCNPEFGDVLVVSRGATVGRICIVDTNEVFCLLGSVILLKLNKQVDSKYISYVLKSPNFQKILTGLSGSTAQQAIYLRDIRNIQIPLPSLVKQRQIVAEIDWRLSVSGKVENAVGTALARAARLRQAILKRAFEGRLVTQNPSGKLAETRPEATGPASETPDLVNFKQAKLF